MLKGDFTQNDNNSGWVTDPIIDFSMKLGDGINTSSAYDEDGNIIKMFQKGILGVVGGTVDDLTYHYFSTSNKLSAVDDPTADIKLGDFTDNNKSGNDYGYDKNGNLITDLNKRLSGTTGLDLASGGAITYNFLNLPSVITVKNADGSAKGTITYIYDAAGNKLEMRTNESASTYNNNTAKQTTTSYLGGFVYENNVLQFFSHEEGRVRYKADKNTYVYDYFLKDHLGNVRMVLTEEQKTDMYPAATMETAQTATEEALYANLSETRTDKSSVPGYPTDNTTSPNDKIAKLNDGGQRIGASIVLKVMAGDKFNIKVSSWYKSNGVNPGTPVSPLTDLVTSLMNGVLAIPNTAQHGITQTVSSSDTLCAYYPGSGYTCTNCRSQSI